MRSANLILTTILLYVTNSTILTGIVSIENEPFGGCEVRVLQNGLSQLTDSEGKFRLVTDDLQELTLQISYFDMTSTLVIEDIPLDSKEINIGTIPLVFNEIVSSSEYEKFNAEKRKKYQEVRHWAQLLGYVSKTKTDTTALRTTLWTDRKIKYRLDTVNNKVIINYKDWSK